MYDAGKILAGLFIFLVVLSSPIWYNMATGKASEVPNPKIVTSEKKCVLPKEQMKADHPALLNTWRQTVVRKGERKYVAPDGREFDMSLTLTCMKCHPNKAEFCDQCHNYQDVKPMCWDCHVSPEVKP